MMGKYIMESNEIKENYDCRYINLGTSVKVDEIGHGGWLKLKRYFKIFGSALKSFYREKPNLVYITLTASGAGFYKDAFIVILAKIFGKKLVYHFHNKGISIRHDHWVDNALYKMIFKNAELILLSKYLYYDIERYVPKDKVHYCANGIPEFKTAKPKVKERKDTVQILFLSNLIESKGVIVLLKACQLLQEKQLPFHCTLIGNEGDISIAQFQAMLNEYDVNRCVHYGGAKYGAEKEEAYAQANIFVHPTLNDCFPLVLLEAMQYELPIVATNEGGIPSIIEDGKTGYLVKKQDAQALADTLEVLIKNPELRLQLGQNGRKRYEDNFTIQKFEKRFTEILNKLV